MRLKIPYSREGNGNPLQGSCLENPRDGGAWWAAVYGVTQSRTRLSDLAAAAGEEATVRTGHGTTDWFQIVKEYVKAVYCHPVYLTYMQSTS